MVRRDKACAAAAAHPVSVAQGAAHHRDEAGTIWNGGFGVGMLGSRFGHICVSHACHDELKSSETSAKQQIVPCKLNNDVLKLLFDMNEGCSANLKFREFFTLGKSLEVTTPVEIK